MVEEIRGNSPVAVANEGLSLYVGIPYTKTVILVVIGILLLMAENRLTTWGW